MLGIIRAYEFGCRNQYEMAEYLEVTEEFLAKALSSYKNKYGPYVKIDFYIVFFEPNLGVMKMI
ncbi:MAG: hypothetical protein WCD89_02365 [Anaerocolumna sp.]